MSRTPYTLPQCVQEGVKLLFPTLDFSRIRFYIKNNDNHPRDAESETMAYAGRTEISLAWRFRTTFLTFPGSFGNVNTIYSPCEPVYYQLLCHELVHALQAQGFWSRINHRAASFVCALFHGQSKQDAQEGNCVEKEAYDYDAQLFAVLSARGVPSPCLCSGSFGPGSPLVQKIVSSWMPARNPSFAQLVKVHPELVKTTAGCSAWDCIPSGIVGAVAGFIATVLAYAGAAVSAFSTSPISTATMVGGAIIGGAAGAAFGIVGVVVGAIIGAIIGVFLGNIIDAIVNLFGGGEGSLNLLFSTDNGQTWPKKHTFDRSAEPMALSFARQSAVGPNNPPGSPATDCLSVAWTGLDNHVNLMTLWPSHGVRADFEESEDCGPAICGAGDRVHVAWQGSDNALNAIATGNGLELVDKFTLAGTECPDDASPAICYTSKHFVLSHIGTDGKIYLLSSTSGTGGWGNMLVLDELATEESTVAVAPLDNQAVMIAWTGEDDHINLVEVQIAANGAMAPVWKSTLDERSSEDAGPALAKANAYLYLAWTGTDGQVNFMMSENRGRSWFNHQVFERSRDNCGPAIAAHGDGTICIGWVGTDS